MKYTNSVEKKITEYFESETKNIEVDKNLFCKIKNNLEENEKGMINMKQQFNLRGLKRFIPVCAILLVTLTSVVVASSKVSSWISFSSNADSFKSFPTDEEVTNTVGYSPKFVETLSNGFKYKSSSIRNSEGRDSQENTIIKCKGFNMFYERENANEGEYLSFSTDNLSEEIFKEEITNSKVEAEQYKGIDLYYNETPYMFVPEDYEITEDEKEKQLKGELQISYGSEEVQHNLIQYVTWYENEIKYTFMGNDTNLSKEDMYNMAKTVIDK